MKTLNELYSEVNSFDEKQTPAQAMQTRRAMGRKMKLLARKPATKFAKKRGLTRRRTPEKLRKAAHKQAKMKIINRALGAVDYKELPVSKRIKIDQTIVAKKRKAIDKMAKKIFRQLKGDESSRIKKNKEAQKRNA